MNIQGSQISRISSLVVPKNRQLAVDPADSPQSADALQVSQKAREVAAGVEALKQAPEVRDDKVSAAKARLAAGQLSAASLADRLLASVEVDGR